MQFLLTNGANPDIYDFKKRTPLIIASRKGNCRTIAILLAHGADIERADSEGFTPLLNAINYGKSEAIELLLDRGANLHHVAEGSGRATMGLSAIYLAALPKKPRILLLSRRSHSPKSLELCKLLLERGADVNLGDKTALGEAVTRQHLDLVTLLVQWGADVLKCDDEGRTALAIARETYQTQRLELRGIPSRRMENKKRFENISALLTRAEEVAKQERSSMDA